MNIPTDYQPGYEKARAIAPEIASNYVAHTLIGDPLGEAMAQDLTELGTEESRRLIEAAMNEEGEEALRNAPASLREFFREAGTPPEWLDYTAFAPAVRMFSQELADNPGGVRCRRSDRGLYNEYSKILLHHGAGARPRRQAFRAEQPSHDGDIPPRRPVQIWRRLETFGPNQDSSRSSETSPDHIRRMGCRSLGVADQRGAPRLRDLRVFGKAVEAYENLGR